MNNTATLLGTLVLTATAVAGADLGSTFNPANLTPGSVVRVAARRPAINLSRAEVVDCTTNVLTVRHKRESFAIAASNLFDIALLERGPDLPVAQTAEAAAPEGTPPHQTATAHASQNLWDRLKQLWDSVVPSKAASKPTPSR